MNEWSQFARFGAAHRWQQQSSSHTTQCRLEVTKCIAPEHFVVIHSFCAFCPTVTFQLFKEFVVMPNI